MADAIDLKFAEAAKAALARTVMRVGRSSAETAPFYFARIAGRSIERVSAALNMLGITSYYPRMRKVGPLPRNRLSRAQRASGLPIVGPYYEPLLPGYVLLQLEQPRAWRGYCAQAHIAGLLCRGEEPVPVREAKIAEWHALEHGDAIDAATPVRIVFGFGDTVKINDGPFAGLSGRVEKALDLPIGDVDAETRIEISISLFGGETPVDLLVWQVVKI